MASPAYQDGPPPEEEVHAPNGGLVDTVNLDLLRGSQASVLTNYHHDRLSLDRRLGRVQVGDVRPDATWQGGFHFRPADGNWQNVEVRGAYLYRWTGSAWVGAVSGLAAAHSPDTIGSNNGLGTWVQFANRLYWYDGGTVRKFWNGSALRTYGYVAGVSLPAGTAAARVGTSTSPGSFRFDGSSLFVCAASQLTGATAHSISCWVKTTNPPDAGAVTIRADSNSNWSSGLQIPNGFTSGHDLFNIFRISPGEGAWVYQGAGNDGSWHHYVGVRNGANLELYRDGALVDDTEEGNVSPPATALGASKVYIGCLYQYNGGSPPASAYLNGNISDVRVWARALSSSEVTTLYGGGDPSTTSIVGRWRLNDGTGTSASDASGNGNSGVLSGNASWSADYPSALGSSPGVVTGGLKVGTYSFVYTYYDPLTGEESDPSEPSNEIDFAAANGSLSATVPTDSHWTSNFSVIRFYRTTADGEAYFFDHEVSNVSSLPITETLTKIDELLGAEVDDTHGAIPQIKYAILFNEMVVGAGDPSSPSTLYWSFPGDPTHWPPQNAQDIDRDNGDPISGIFRLLGRLYVIKQTSGIYMLTPRFAADGTVSFSVEAVTSDWGALSHHAIVVIDTYAYWPDAKGICKFNGQQVTNISDPKIRYRWKTLASGSNATRCYAIHDRQADHQYYRLTIEDPTDSKAYDLIYDTSTDAWLQDVAPSAVTGQSTRGSWLVKLSNAQYAVFQGDNTGRTFRLRTDLGNNPVYADAGVAFTSNFKSRHWGGINGVLPLWLELEYERSDQEKTSGTITVSLYADGQSTARVTDTTSVALYDVTTATSTSVLAPEPTRATHCVRVDFDGQWCRRFAFGIDCSGAAADLKILWYRICYVPLGPMTRAI